MAGATLTVDDAEAEGTLAGLLAALGDLTPVLQNIGEHVQATTIERFARQVSPEGAPWKPLNPAYAETKKGPGILREAGQLAQIIYQVAGEKVEIGTNAIHGAVHQFGDTIRPKTASALVFSLGGRTIFADHVDIPARPYLGLTGEDQTEIRDIVADYLDAATGGEMEFA